jgi:hypothetical protein
MSFARIIMVIALIAAVIFYFYKRSKYMREKETEERLRDLFR